MDFLKNHYEKIVLSLVLIGLAAVGVWLALQAMAFRGTIEATNALQPQPSPPGGIAETNQFFEALTNSKTPRRVDFDGDHKIFNPEKILKNPRTRMVLPANDLGPKAIEVLKIRPLYLRTKLEMKKVRDRITINLHYLSEFEAGRYATRWNRTSLKAEKKIRMSSPLARMRQMQMLVNSVNMTPETPEQMSAELEFTIGAGLPQIIVLKGEEESKIALEYEADLHYPPDPENDEFKNVRKDKPLVFGGDTNTVMQVSSNAITLRALSNFKRTIRKLEDKTQIQPAVDKMAPPPADGEMAKPDMKAGDATSAPDGADAAKTPLEEGKTAPSVPADADPSAASEKKDVSTP